MAELKTVAAELKRGEVIFFLGAGMSKCAGMPTAPELAQLLPTDFKPPDIENPTLVDIADFCDAEGRRAQLNTEIRKLVKSTQDSLTAPSPAHLVLARLKDVNLVVTTNWDTLLENACDALSPKRPYYAIVTDGDLEGRPKYTGTLNILKMHGTLDSPSSYIVGEDDFARFKHEHPSLYRRLENIFIDQTVILVGYGLGDENVKRAYNDVRFERRIPRQVYAVNPFVSKSRMGVWRGRNVEVLTDPTGKPYDALAFFAELEQLLGIPGPVSIAPTIPLAASRYLTYLIDVVRPLTFQAIVQLERAPVTLDVDDLYVKLYAAPEMPRAEMVEHLERKPHEQIQAIQRERGASEPVRIEDALKKHNALVVLGHPGSGKTTLLRYLAVVFAQGRTDEKLGLKENRVPFLVPLAAYNAALRQNPNLDLLRFIPAYWRTDTMAYDIAPLLQEHLAEGTALILLDGLDEVFESAERKRVVERVKTFIEKWKEGGTPPSGGNRFVVTSRIIGYRDAPLETEDIAHFTLQDFTEEEIRWFAHNWWSAYLRWLHGDTASAREEATREAERLTATIFRDPGVQSLATNPLLLTILALIHYSGKELPQKRVELYELYVKTLITSWSRHRTLAREALGSLEEVEAIKILAPLALWMHREHPAGTAPREEIEKRIQVYYARKMTAAEADTAARSFLESLRKYTSLLIERGENAYGFLHLTFEEYLAARGAIFEGQVERPNIFGALCPHLYIPAWREVVRLTAEHLSLIAREEATASLFIRNILRDTPSPEEDRGKNAVLAGACLLNIGAAGVEKDLWDDTREKLYQTMIALDLPFATRRDAGITLGELGWLPGDLDDMMPVARGTFVYGDKNKSRQIRYDFEIGKYPITNAQFKRFMLAGGYGTERWWSAKGWSLREQDKLDRPRLWDDPRWNNPLQPVVGVSWYEAEAYCRWLAEETGKDYRLPTEEEWEKAARGEKGKFYPWGDDFDQRKANTFESGLVATTPVMMYPEGKSDYGVFDLSGNVWEWTSSMLSQEEQYPVLRGASWFLDSGGARCATRSWRDPVWRDPVRGGDRVGFRCARSFSR
jgi:formylglycine-generating enzyme required for sulfatase activity/NAD-dependent SIR2 family protein deacetylase/energy-coupling factor transporter ATP-binding protein EcfA2